MPSYIKEFPAVWTNMWQSVRTLGHGDPLNTLPYTLYYVESVALEGWLPHHRPAIKRASKSRSTYRQYCIYFLDPSILAEKFGSAFPSPSNTITTLHSATAIQNIFDSLTFGHHIASRGRRLCTTKHNYAHSHIFCWLRKWIAKGNAKSILLGFVVVGGILFRTFFLYIFLLLDFFCWFCANRRCNKNSIFWADEYEHKQQTRTL